MFRAGELPANRLPNIEDDSKPATPETRGYPTLNRSTPGCRGAAHSLLVYLTLAAGLGVAPAVAYVGPGAGFALASSFFAVFLTIVIAFLVLLIWPFRKLYRLVRLGRKPKSKIKRLIVVGLDGQDPRLTDRFMKQGLLPNFEKLAEQGCYLPIRTTYPAISPVAWSSFSTGTEPAKHNIFDFLARDPKTYLPVLSSTEIGKVEKSLKLGKYRIPLHKPELRLLRKSKPFWTILGEKQIWSTVLRVPITFPPDRFYGAELSAMSVPDLLGTQGTFLLFTTRPSHEKFKEGGMRIPLTSVDGNGTYAASIEGPGNVFVDGEPPMELPVKVELDRTVKKARVSLNGDSVELEPGKLSDWVPLEFPAAFGVKAHGICRLMITEMGEHFSLYMTPISLNPENPAMPVSHPSYYATYLSKLVGKYSTMGLAEDTWALNEDVVDDGTFLQMAYDIDNERQEMFFGALERLREGSLVCVFDGTDRIQHMFWRYLEEGHPAAEGKADAPHKEAIEELYKHNDQLVGRVMKKLQPGDMMMVLSDHGFTSFRRGINLNSWLHENGYLVLKQGCDGSSEWLRDVDWSKTRAYALGLTGVFLNMKGREAEGIVEPGEETAALKRELIDKMSGLRDPDGAKVGINELFDTAALYQGPYLTNAPDFIVGYNHGYRISWDGATGVVTGPVWEDNVKAWSGDHGVDPRIVPGVFFCNHKLDHEDPALIDIAPTVLQLFGLKAPAHMDGRTLFDEGRTFDGEMR